MVLHLPLVCEDILLLSLLKFPVCILLSPCQDKEWPAVGNWPTGCFASAEVWELPQKDLSVQREKNNRLRLRNGRQKLSADLMNDIFLIGIVLPEGCWQI